MFSPPYPKLEENLISNKLALINFTFKTEPLGTDIRSRLHLKILELLILLSNLYELIIFNEQCGEGDCFLSIHDIQQITKKM